jgi:23S rRNA (cytidine1920-2'-O)/16S rRNA (cytidine1409-2'-O)-methyltransferase
MTKTRLDLLLVRRGLAASREKAAALIMAGRVLVSGQPVRKAGREVPYESDILLTYTMPYVSRGGLKLEAALDSFEISPVGLTVMDAGASTGGFTDCLLQRGAGRVLALDVGYGQFDWRLRNDPRVVLRERMNARFLDKSDLPFTIDAAVADLSFISLRLILAKLFDAVTSGGWVVPLVKPQFEAGRQHVGKGGVVRDADKIREVVREIAEFSLGVGFAVVNQMECPVRGPRGNREFFLHLARP